MKIQTTQTIKDLKGVPLNNNGMNLTVGEAIGEILIATVSDSKVKAFILAQRLVNEPEVELDEIDFKKIYEAVQINKRYIDLVSGQILVILDGLKTSK